MRASHRVRKSLTRCVLRRVTLSEIVLFQDLQAVGHALPSDVELTALSMKLNTWIEYYRYEQGMTKSLDDKSASYYVRHRLCRHGLRASLCASPVLPPCATCAL